MAEARDVPTVSEDGAAILLLTTHLGAATSKGLPAPLQDREWSTLAERILHSRLERPGRMFGLPLLDLASELSLSEAETERLGYLLSRGAQLAMQLDRWQRQGVWVLTRADFAYPASVKRALGKEAPAALFGVGSLQLLEAEGPGLIVSVKAIDADHFARAMAASTARAGLVLKAAASNAPEDAALETILLAGGRSVVVGQPPDRVLRQRLRRDSAIAGALCVISTREPGARPLAAAERTKLLGSLVRALVLAPPAIPGDSRRFLPPKRAGLQVYVRLTKREPLEPDLRARGAQPIPVTSDVSSSELEHWLAEVSRTPVAHQPPWTGRDTPSLPLYRLFIEAFAAAGQPMTSQEAAVAFDLVEAQARAWLLRAVAEGLADEAKGGFLMRSGQDRLPL